MTQAPLSSRVLRKPADWDLHRRRTSLVSDFIAVTYQTKIWLSTARQPRLRETRK